MGRRHPASRWSAPPSRCAIVDVAAIARLLASSSNKVLLDPLCDVMDGLMNELISSIAKTLFVFSGCIFIVDNWFIG
jgi:hypothetical protein